MLQNCIKNIFCFIYAKPYAFNKGNERRGFSLYLFIHLQGIVMGEKTTTMRVCVLVRVVQKKFSFVLGEINDLHLYSWVVSLYHSISEEKHKTRATIKAIVFVQLTNQLICFKLFNKNFWLLFFKFDVLFPLVSQMCWTFDLIHLFKGSITYTIWVICFVSYVHLRSF